MCSIVCSIVFHCVPLWVLFGPDQNPWCQKTIKCAIKYFDANDLDCLFIATNAPGRSAFNQCEQQMAHLSKELSGVILEHNHFGDHLDEKGNTIDTDLEVAVV